MRPTSFFYKVLWRNMLPIKLGTPERTPSLFRALGYFTCVTQHTGQITLRLIWRTKQWLSVLLNDTNVTTRTGTHTLLIRNTRAWVGYSYPLGHSLRYINLTDWSRTKDIKSRHKTGLSLAQGLITGFFWKNQAPCLQTGELNIGSAHDNIDVWTKAVQSQSKPQQQSIVDF